MALLAKVTVLGAALVAAGGLFAARGATDKAAPPSPYLSAAIKAGLPEYQPAAAAPMPPNPAPFLAEPAAQSANDGALVRMAKVEVREAPVPHEAEVLTYRGRSDRAMAEYLGDSDSLDRGFLNHFTILDLWRRIPILGRFPFASSISNEDRALLLHGEDERMATKNYFRGLVSFGAVGEKAAALKEELKDIESTLGP